MSCPQCNKHSRQEWSNGYPATLETPEEYAGYECGWCGHTYSNKQEHDATYGDWLYDQQKDLE